MSSKPAPLILGHNQFIGVDHLSQDKGREREQRFADAQRILDLIAFAHAEGVEGLMMSTHQRVREILPLIASDTRLAPSLRMYPIIPYAQGYVRRANEVGLVRMGMEAIEGATAGKKLGMAWTSGLGLLRRDVFGLLGSLVDTELLPLKGLKVDCVILHNVLTDMLLGWGAEEAFRFFDEHVRDKHGVRPAYATFNYPLLMNRFEEWGMARPLVLTSFNPMGFQMNPSREACEETLARGTSDVIAMSVFAAGLVSPTKAVEYLSTLGRVESVVFGASSPAHVSETSKLLRDRHNVVSSGRGAEGLL